MENLVNGYMDAFWRGRRVFITGSTGFKGSWLAVWLARYGAVLCGYALPALQRDDLFNAARVGELCPTVIGDIRDSACLTAALQDFAPQTVFHLAAQSLVRRSYVNPLETFSTNLMGTCNLLNAARDVSTLESVLVVSTDKCYRNREWDWGYRENDELGGSDPYSASKAAVEIAVESFRRSFYAPGGIGLASARGGNVVGGGDFAMERLVPDIARAWRDDQEIVLRYPKATRPWQHVLDCLSGYICLARAVTTNRDSFSRGFNFGPDATGEATVLTVLEELGKKLPVRRRINQAEQPYEAARLTLDTSLARQSLGWRPRLSLVQTLDWTGTWYADYFGGRDARELTQSQISNYEILGQT